MANIDYDKFIRTTDQDHKDTVTKVWGQLKDKDLITLGKHQGYYSVNEETFMMEKDLIWDKASDSYKTQVGETVKLVEEENFVYTFKNLQDVRKWASRPGAIVPQSIQKEIIEAIDHPRGDLSVSRPISRISWGISVPDDSNQTVYVWLDALTNYLTILGMEKAEKNVGGYVHFVGKDIAKFHCIYWPSFLMALYGKQSLPN